MDTYTDVQLHLFIAPLQNYNFLPPPSQTFAWSTSSLYKNAPHAAATLVTKGEIIHIHVIKTS